MFKLAVKIVNIFSNQSESLIIFLLQSLLHFLTFNSVTLTIDKEIDYLKILKISLNIKSILVLISTKEKSNFIAIKQLKIKFKLS